jgi:hypothetical protein
LTSERLIYTHLYATEKDTLTNFTSVGFAAIGIGKSHAESQFMFSGHWPLKPFDETVLLSYAAKKRAEVAPGVGKATDMVVIGPMLGFSIKVEDEHIVELDRIYQKSRRSDDRAVKIAQSETKEFIARVRPGYDRKTETPQAESPTAPTPSESDVSRSQKS